ncbi:MAG: DUF2723 domain-containing protein [Anaerolineae bacterium]|nr:DUF2723 domain-containing protein [Anaerolineae bacterium]
MQENQDQPLMSLPRTAWLLALLVTMLSLGVYLWTLYPGAGPFLDSFELQTAALVQGVVHPPGSPQYLMLGRLAMTILPGPNPAYRLNLLSALAGAATVGIVYLLTYRLTRSLFASGYAGLCLALGLHFWFESIITELYALNALYVALVMYWLLAWHQTGRRGFYWAAVVVYALSFGNHQSMILLLPAFIYIVAITDRAMLLRPRYLLITAGIVLLAALQYLYIPIRAAAQPPFCNYCPGLIPSLRDYLRGSLMEYLTGGPFKGQMFAMTYHALLSRLPDSIWEWNKEFMPWGYILGLIGAWELLRRKLKLAALLLLGMAAQYIFVMGYDIPDWYTFLTPCYVLFAPLVGYGAVQVWERFKPVDGSMQHRAYAVLLPVLAVLTIAAGFYTNYRPIRQSGSSHYTHIGKTLLENAQPGAWLIMPRPHSTAFYYSWAIQYLAFEEEQPSDRVIVPPAFFATWDFDLLSTAEDILPRLVMVSTPEVNPPPGPEPYYLPWDSAVPRLGADRLLEAQQRGTRPQILVLDPTDDRVQGWGLLPICTPDSNELTGYEVVALAGDLPIPLVDATRWESIQSSVYYPSGQGEPGCPSTQNRVEDGG